MTNEKWKVMPVEADKDYIRVRGTLLGQKFKIANVPFVRVGEKWVTDREQNEAKQIARLIAAAPDMLEACKCAETVLILLSEEVARLGLRAENVLPELKAAIKRAETGE